MSAADILRKLAPEDVEDIAKRLEKSLHQHKDELSKQIGSHLADVKSNLPGAKKCAPRGCKLLGLLIVVGAAAVSFALGRKSAG